MKYKIQETAERIRGIRKGCTISQEKLISDLKDNHDFRISRNRLSAFENGAEQCTMEFLIAFSKYFNCDIGYLLCEYDEKTINKHQICEYTGLSQKAVEKILFWNNCDDYRRFWSRELLSSLIEAEETENLLLNIAQIIGFAEWETKSIYENKPNDAIDFLDLQMARHWYVSKLFTDIVENLVQEARMGKVEQLKDGTNNG